jgi:hypothetical protein
MKATKVFITKETVLAACKSLPPALSSQRDVMEVDVTAVDGRAATIEFIRYYLTDEAGNTAWRWEATTCWETHHAP